MYNHAMNLQLHNKTKAQSSITSLVYAISMQNRRPGEVQNGPDNKETFEVGQPCPLLSSQIHKISPSTLPWTAGPLGLPSARQCSHHHSHQIGGSPSWGQGTEQWQHCHPQYTSERHCFHPVEKERNKGSAQHQLSTHAGHDISPSNKSMQ